MNRRSVTVSGLALLFGACASGNYLVPDVDYFSDGYVLDKNTIQVVESFEDPGLVMPAAERFARNCESAEARARARHRAVFTASKDDGVRLSARFDRNAGCTVRMAIKKQ